LAEFAVNNKVYSMTKISLFIANYGRELRMEADIRKKGKVEKAMEFVERLKKIQEEAEAALKKAQEEMKRYMDRKRKKTEDWKKEDRVMLSTKDLVFKERPVHKLVERYIGLYEIKKVVSANTVKLQLPSSMRIHPVVNVSYVVQYREQVKEQKKEEGKLAEVEGVEKWEVKKILNKRKIRGVNKYLVWWKGFTAEGDMWEKEEDLKNAKELVDNFEERVGAEIRCQERIEKKGEREEYRRMKLLGKYMAKLLYGWDDRKFEEEYLKKVREELEEMERE